MSSLAIEGIYLKPYAACRHCHPAIEAAICLRENHNLDYESVAAVRVITYDLAVFGHDHSDVRGNRLCQDEHSVWRSSCPQVW